MILCISSTIGAVTLMKSLDFHILSSAAFIPKMKSAQNFHFYKTYLFFFFNFDNFDASNFIFNVCT